MSARNYLADVLAEYMRRPDYPYTPGLLHRRSGVPKATIVNWLEGRVERPRYWQDIAKVAAALRLAADETDRLLQSAGHSPLAGLRTPGLSQAERALLDVWAIPGQAPPPTALGHSALPTPATPLIGRERDLRALAELLHRDGVRLATLLGPGGAGKTRLALQVASNLSPTFPDGAVFVPLAAVRDPALVAATVAQALGIADADAQPIQARLLAALHDKHMLLVLDNFEHLLAAAGLIAELLAAAPGLKVLATSRAVLHLSGEHEYEVPPLPLPAAPTADLGGAALATLGQYDALRLFIERTQAVKPEFALTAANAAAVVAICRKLDGLPLAIELAAARAKLLAPAALLARLEGAGGRSALDLLVGGARDLPEHQQTLRGTIAWSYRLLEPAEQRLAAWLAVCVGGCTLETAEALLPLPDTLAAAASLVDKSLLHQEEGDRGEPRFAMLETIREYAFEQLVARGDLAAAQLRHAEVFLALAEAAARALPGADERAWLGQLEREHGNLRAALAWALGGAAPELGARLAGALGDFWWARGYITEGRQWLARALEGRLALPNAVRAKAEGRAAMLAWVQGDYEAAGRLCNASLDFYRAAGDQAGTAWVLRHLGYIAWDRGEYPGAAAQLEESLALARAAGDKHGVARALHLLGWVAVVANDEPLAEARYQECLALCRELGDTQFAAHALNDLGLSQRRQGDYQQAKALIEGGLALRRELGIQSGIAWSLLNLGLVARDQGDSGRAARHFGDCLQLRRSMGDRRGVAECLEGLAAVLGRAGAPEQAIQLYAMAAALREAIGAPLLPFDQADHTAQLAAARAQLSPDTCTQAWAVGCTLTLDQAARLADAIALPEERYAL